MEGEVMSSVLISAFVFLLQSRAVSINDSSFFFFGEESLIGHTLFVKLTKNLE